MKIAGAVICGWAVGMLWAAGWLVAAEPNYPVLNDLELTERLKREGMKLMELGQAKGSADLAPQLERKSLAKPLALPPASTKPVADGELYNQACQSMFVLSGLAKTKEKMEDWEGAFATAFAVTADGVLTTSRHFFADPEPCDAFFVVDRGGQVFPVVEILASDEKRDTCLFRILANNLRPLPLGENPAPGSRVRVVSHPGYFFYFFSAGNVGNYFLDDDSQTWMNITADFGQGSSGGPVFDDNGNVVGQATSTLTLYATGPPLEEPLVARRRLGQRPLFSPVAGLKAAPGKARATAQAEPKLPEKPKKEKKRKPKPEPDPAPEEISDPQIVFKTCTPVNALRALTAGP